MNVNVSVGFLEIQVSEAVARAMRAQPLHNKRRTSMHQDVQYRMVRGAMMQPAAQYMVPRTAATTDGAPFPRLRCRTGGAVPRAWPNATASPGRASSHGRAIARGLGCGAREWRIPASCCAWCRGRTFTSIRQLGSVHSIVALHIHSQRDWTSPARVRCVLSSLCCVPPSPLLSPSAGPGLRPWLETGLVLTDTAVKSSCRAALPFVAA